MPHTPNTMPHHATIHTHTHHTPHSIAVWGRTLQSAPGTPQQLHNYEHWQSQRCPGNARVVAGGVSVGVIHWHTHSRRLSLQWGVLRGRWHVVCALFHSFRFLLLFSFGASHLPPLSLCPVFHWVLTNDWHSSVSASRPGPLHMPLYGMKKRTQREGESEREVELVQLSQCQQIKGAFRASSASSPEHLERINRHIFPLCVRVCVCFGVDQTACLTHFPNYTLPLFLSLSLSLACLRCRERPEKKPTHILCERFEAANKTASATIFLLL